MEPELKTVPCECGGKVAISRLSDSAWEIQCQKCYYWARGSSEAKAIEFWNQRPDWKVHEFNSIYTEEEYKRIVKEYGGKIIETKYWKTKVKLLE